MLAQPRGVAAGGEERAAAIGPTNHREMTMTGADYVHGYSGGEAERLTDQADVLAALLHDGITFPAGDSVLEPGCGVGSQTVHLAARSPGARIVAVEGDHGSAYFHPDSEAARRAIGCLVELQARSGGDSLIGRLMYPLLTAAGFHGVRVEPRMVYADSSLPHLVEGFTLRTFTAMVEGVREEALGQGLVSEIEWEQGVADLHRTAEQDGVFCYTFFRVVAFR